MDLSLVKREPDQNVEPVDAGFSDSRLDPEALRLIDAYWRAANYLSVGQLYLYDNPLLREPLRLDCGSACKKDPASGVIGVQKGTTIPMV